VSRNALITGASSGIGLATACLLAAQGYRVALLARREDKLRRIGEDLKRAGALEPLVLPCDLAQPLQIEDSIARLKDAWGSLDLLVNNAGVGYRARVEELEHDKLEHLFRVNVFGPMHTCRLCLPLLRRSQAASVVLVASVVGRRGIPGQSAYSASKAALVSLGEALRIEWARDNIAVSVLQPALTATGFFEAQANPSGLATPDLSGASGPEEVAAAILELDQHPRPELSMRWKWRMLSVLSILSPRWSDRVLARRLGERWIAPRR
jgi:short-subunit dehydrogenase